MHRCKIQLKPLIDSEASVTNILSTGETVLQVVRMWTDKIMYKYYLFYCCCLLPQIAVKHSWKEISLHPLHMTMKKGMPPGTFKMALRNTIGGKQGRDKLVSV